MLPSDEIDTFDFDNLAISSNLAMKMNCKRMNTAVRSSLNEPEESNFDKSFLTVSDFKPSVFFTGFPNFFDIAAEILPTR